MAGKITPENKLTVNKAAVMRQISESENRKQLEAARRRRLKWEAAVFLGVLAVFIVTGIEKRSSWYVNYGEPIVTKLRTISCFGKSEDVSRKGAFPSYANLPESVWLTKKETSSDSLRQPSGYPEYRAPRRPDDVSSGALASSAKAVLNKSTRPRPADLDFYSLKPQVRRHVLSQPKSLRALEGERVTILASARHHLILLMRYVPYETGPKGLRLKSKNAGPGTIVGANERGFLFVPRHSGGQTVIPWADISLDQYVAFFQYYIAKRLQLDGTPTWDMFNSPAELTPINGRRDAAGECLLAGLMCDWYGKPEIGEKFLRLAVQYNPRSPARRFLMARSGK